MSVDFGRPDARRQLQSIIANKLKQCRALYAGTPGGFEIPRARRPDEPDAGDQDKLKRKATTAVAVEDTNEHPDIP
ncbi:hypothetical protein NKJ36_32725 [Mesorhizobium sp. M0142]|uniref:hypothetical protein n=1 Tax=unclassified Mesorhizobium TaxID=325217 RepID=UPI003334ABBA